MTRNRKRFWGAIWSLKTGENKVQLFDAPNSPFNKIWNQRIRYPETECLPDPECKPDPGRVEDPGEIKRTCGHLTRCPQVILSRKIEPDLSIRPLQKHCCFFLVVIV